MGTLFPWVVSGFSLIDAMEAVIVKVPRVPVADDSMTGEQRLTARFTSASNLSLSLADIPTKTEDAPIVGKMSVHALDDLKGRRPDEAALLLAKLTLEKYFRDDSGNDNLWLFPQVLGIAKRWLTEGVSCKGNAFRQLLLLIGFAHGAADRIYKAVAVTGAQRGSYDQVQVIVEAKGCWHRERKTATNTQLVDRYLRKHRCQHGLYLVGWYNRQPWFPKSPSSLLGTSSTQPPRRP